uniref:Immunoglobulin domain-containing protein n=1 Tax=Hippocampus comes TaxID=109280 RepID=A0A3Q2YIE2_HIPCM
TEEFSHALLTFFREEPSKDNQDTVVEVTGVSGKDITITCSHDSAFDNVKYFCNSVCKRDKDVLIKSREWYSQEKYSIVDARNIFNVTIFHLTKQDAGTYWCGWEKFGLDIYQKVVLTVREGEWINQKISKHKYAIEAITIINRGSHCLPNTRRLSVYFLFFMIPALPLSNTRSYKGNMTVFKIKMCTKTVINEEIQLSNQLNKW